MNIFLTGATGFVGQTVTQALLESNGIEEVESLNIRALVRDPAGKAADQLRALPFAKGHLEIVEGDILDPTSLGAALEDGSIDAVVHLVGIIAEQPSKGITFERIHYLGTRNVVDAALAAGIDRYLQMSALGTEAGAEADYHKTKWAAEEYVRASGLDWTIFRPSIVFGEDDLFINRFALFVDLKIFGVPLPKFGTTKFQPVAVEDVAEAFAEALERPETIGETYDLVGPDVVTLKELIETIEDVKGTWAPKIPMPIQATQLASNVLKFMPYPFDLNPDQVTMMKKDSVGDIGPMKKDLGLKPTPFREGIAAYLTVGGH